jgi:hypothetical protein
MKTRHKLIFSAFLALIELSASVNAADFSITENTKVQEIKTQLGTPVRSLISEKKTTDFFDPNKYTFLDAYNNSFGVVILGIHPISYRLSKNIDEKNTALIKANSLDKKQTSISIFGVNLGMSFASAEKLIQELATFDKFMTAKNGGVEYLLTNGSRIVINTDTDNVVSSIELFLK